MIERSAKPSNFALESPTEEDEPSLVDLYEVILFNDDEHTYDYVCEMLTGLFSITPQQALDIAYEVDYIGQSVVRKCPLDQAVRDRDRIINYGPDHRMEISKGSMMAAIQKAC